MILEEISLKVQAGKAKDTKALVQQAIDEGFSAQDILEKGLIDGMNVIGGKFKNNEVFVPEVLVAARAMNQGAALLKPLLAAEKDTIFTGVLEEYHVNTVVYGHLHGAGIQIGFTGEHNGISYHLVSCDSIGFEPKEILL